MKLTNANNKTGIVITYGLNEKIPIGMGSGKTFMSKKLEESLTKNNWYCIILNTDSLLKIGLEINQVDERIKENIEEIKKLSNDKIIVIIDMNGIKDLKNFYEYDFTDWKHIIVTPNFTLQEVSEYKKSDKVYLDEMLYLWSGFTCYNILARNNSDYENYINPMTLPFNERQTDGIIITSLTYEPVYFTNSISDINKIIKNGRKKILLKNYDNKEIKIKATKYLEFLEKNYPNENLIAKHKIVNITDEDYDYDDEENTEIINFIKSPLDICKTLHLNSIKPLLTYYGQRNCVFSALANTLNGSIENVKVRHKKYLKYLEENYPIDIQIENVISQIEDN